MSTKNYKVREGFVVVQRVKNTTSPGGAYDKVIQGGETVALDDDTAAQHAHKLEFADEADIEAALAAEQQAAVAKHATNAPVALVSTLVEALQHALTGAGQAVAAAVDGATADAAS